VKREIPQVLIGLLALAVTVPVTAAIVMNGIRDVKGTRDTVVVTGSAKQPSRRTSRRGRSTSRRASARWPPPTRSENAKAAAVDEFLRKAGLASDVSKPPLEVQETSAVRGSSILRPARRT
jgi:hypothetical protein